MSAALFQRARALLLEASLDPGRWLEALEAVSDACGGRSGQLVALDGRGDISLHLLSGVPESDRGTIEAFGLANPRVNPRLRIGLGAAVMEPVADQFHVDQEARKRHPIYAEMFEPFELDFNCQAVLSRSEDLLMRTSITRSAKQGPLESDDFRMFSALLPYIGAAARLQLSIQTVRDRAIIQSMEAISAEAFLLDSQGLVMAASSTAERLALAGDVLRIRSRQLEPVLEADRAGLAEAIAEALAVARGAASAPSRSVALRSRNGGTRIIDVSALPAEREGFPGGSVLAVARPRAAMPTVDLIRGVYDLTEAEAFVALRLAEGTTLRDIAALRGVSLVTVRSQLQTIYLKLRVRRQAELVAVVRALG